MYKKILLFGIVEVKISNCINLNKSNSFCNYQVLQILTFKHSNEFCLLNYIFLHSFISLQLKIQNYFKREIKTPNVQKCLFSLNIFKLIKQNTKN